MSEPKDVLPKDDVSEDELDQIIQDMSQEAEVEPEAVAAVTPPAVPSTPTAAAEATAEAPAAPVETKAEVVPIKKIAAVKTEAPAAAPGSPATNSEQRLALEMTGVINLKLSFSQGERSIELICSEETLICRMADGAEFRIPTGVAKKRKAA
jgi:hypothetical protein